MSIKKLKITIKGVKEGKETIIYNTEWDGDVDDWVNDIGSEFVTAIAGKKYDEVLISSK
jgi:hypothetical protein